jgi:hypothetical protein
MDGILQDFFYGFHIVLLNGKPTAALLSNIIDVLLSNTRLESIFY